jgi:hypothetical protein
MKGISYDFFTMQYKFLKYHQSTHFQSGDTKSLLHKTTEKLILICYMRGERNQFLRHDTEYKCAPVSTGNTFQDPPRLREMADNTVNYIQHNVRVTSINTLEFY